jgi:DNA topoisomerase I
MAKNLVIVESPAKAKTIEGFLGKDFTVKSSFGHVRDLAESGLAIDIENNFEPTYAISSDKEKVVEDLRRLSNKADMVWLATDEDREGEAISWHLKESLELKDSKTKRITFNEITKNAILKAIDNPRKIDSNLVDAQQARRVLDRLVGYELSPILWRKVKPSLSAGRVQSVTVRLVVEREREIIGFKSQTFYRTVAIFKAAKGNVKAELNKRFTTLKEAEDFLTACKNAEFKITSLVKKPAKRSPSAPFTTSTLQQEASRKLGFSVARTMQIAQKLYEAGHITYMRTDSVNLSDTAMTGSKNTILKMFGENYANPRKYVTKSKGAQEAHEAIRPTYFETQSAGSDQYEQKLYELIWKRTVASQMADAQLEKTTVQISVTSRNELFIAEGEVIKFDGFLKVYMESSDDEDTDEEKEGTLPAMTEGEKLQRNEITSTQRFTHHPARYTEASLVKKLEELGIGRPSTYAPTISTVQKRGYVLKEDRPGTKRLYDVLTLKGTQIDKRKDSENTGAEKSKLFPTDIGMLVTDFLVNHFEDVLDYNFTASVEKEFDDVAQGIMKWNEMIRKFYGPFHKDVEKTLKQSERVTGERDLGKEPGTGKRVFVRLGRFGPMVQIGESDAEEKPRFASLRSNQSLATITLDEAMELFKLPREVGMLDGKKIVANIGRFGPYISHDGTFASLKADLGDDPMSVSLERSIELLLAKKEADLKKILKKFSENKDAVVLKGRWGPFLKVGRLNFRLPKGTVVEDMTYADVEAIMEANPQNNGKGKGKSKGKTKAAPEVKKAAAVKSKVVADKTKSKPADKKKTVSAPAKKKTVAKKPAPKKTKSAPAKKKSKPSKPAPKKKTIKKKSRR